MGRGVFGLVVWIVARGSLAYADPEPQPTPAPSDVSWYGPSHPSATPSIEHRIRRRVLRGGAFFLGGVSYVDAPYGRFDLGVPTPVSYFPRLRTTLITEMRSGTDMDDTARRVLVLTPTVQYEWHLPFEPKRGEVLLITAAGLRRNELWVKKPDEPFWPSRWESSTAYAFKLTAGLEYRSYSGLIVSFQPSVGLPMNTPDPPDARWMKVTPDRDIGIALVVGYQLR